MPQVYAWDGPRPIPSETMISIQKLHLIGAAMSVSGASKLTQAAPAGELWRYTARPGTRPPMSETDEYILNAIENWVWSGFYSPDEVDAMIDDILEDDADETMLRAAVAPEFDKKAAAEASWPDTTDCDRLDQAFEELNSRGVIALHNAGYTMSDGISDVSEALQERGSRENISPQLSYHASLSRGSINCSMQHHRTEHYSILSWMNSAFFIQYTSDS